MKKFEGARETKGYTYGSAIEKLTKGKYIIKILEAIEFKSKTGLDMLSLKFDICEGSFSNYYRMKSTLSKENKWGGMYYQLIENEDGTINPFFKGIIDSFEKSSGEEFDFDNPDVNWFVDKKIGGVFNYEQVKYKNKTYEVAKLQKIVAIEDLDSVNIDDSNNNFEEKDLPF